MPKIYGTYAVKNFSRENSKCQQIISTATSRKNIPKMILKWEYHLFSSSASTETSYFTKTFT